MIQRIPHQRLLPIVIAVVIVACSGGGSPNPSAAPPSVDASPSVQPSVGPSFEPSVEPSTSAEPSATNPETTTACPSGGSPAKGDVLSTTDPAVSAALPEGWQEVPLTEYRSLLDQAIGSVNDEQIQAALTWQLELIDAGVVRNAAAGRSEPSGFSASMGLMIIPSTGDLQTTVDMNLNEQAQHNWFTEVAEIVETELPIGPAFCVGTRNEAGTPSLTVQYYVQVGESVAILTATAPQIDTGFPAIVRSVALSMARG